MQLYVQLEDTVAKLSDKISQLEELNEHFENEVKVSEDKINALTSSLEQSSVRNEEMEQKLKSIQDSSLEHELQASTSRQRNLELEDLIAISHGKHEDTANKLTELESPLENSNRLLKIWTSL